MYDLIDISNRSLTIFMVVGKWITILFCVIHGATMERQELERSKVRSSGESVLDLVIPGYSPKENDEYACVAMKVPSDGYIVEFMPMATSDKVHHMLAYGCEDPMVPSGEIWDCGRNTICKSPVKILYAWSRDAPPMNLPDGVGVPIGSDQGARYLVLQVHYGRASPGDLGDNSGVRIFLTQRQPQYVAGIFLLASSHGLIPSNASNYAINMSCTYNANGDMRPFAFRTHTHQLGRVVSAYKLDGGKKTWTLIGTGNPKWPQAFYPVEQPVIVRRGDVIAAQCVYDSSGRHAATSLGAGEKDEMCNFYIYYYTEAGNRDTPAAWPVCNENQRDDLFLNYPPARVQRTQPVTKMEANRRRELGNGYMHHFGTVSHSRVVRQMGANRVGIGRGVGDGAVYGVGINNPAGDGFESRPEPVYLNSAGVPMTVVDGGMQYGPRQAYPSHVRKKPGPGMLVDGRVVWRPDSSQNGPTAFNAGRYYSNGFGLGNQPDPSPVRQPTASGFVAVERTGWPSPDISLGQIAGITLDSKGNVVLFHRVDRVWNENSFDETNRFRERTSGPIMDDTVVYMNPAGNIVFRWGRGFFYMPHGVFADKDDYLWTTDVAMHQVFKFDARKPAAAPLLTLGTEFEPGVDEHHFCKPAAVATAADGTIFVADGYCNNRIVKFNSKGVFLSAWGEAASELLPGGYPKMGSLALPHSLSLHDPSNRLFVADRENARVQIFSYNGTVLGQITDPRFATTVYAAAYCEAYDTVYILNGPSSTRAVDARIFAVDGTSKTLTYSWRPQTGDFQRPHALVASKDCSRIFVGEIGPNKVWRFDVNATVNRASLSAVGRNFANVAKKPDTVDASDGQSPAVVQSMSQLLAVLTVAIAVPVLIIAAVCLCIRFRKRGGFRAMNMTATYRRSNGNKKDGGRLPLLNGAFRDRNGFQRLSTEDVDAMDELSDESETEDTLYPVAQNNSTAPQKA